MIDNWNIFKKFIIPQFVQKMPKIGPELEFLEFLKTFIISFVSWEWFKLKASIVIDISPPITCLAKFCSRVMGRNAVVNRTAGF